MLAIGLSLLGAVLMLTDGQWVWPWPQSTSDWLALSAGVGFSLTNVITRFSTHLTIAAKGMLVWLGVFALSLLILLWQSGTAGMVFVMASATTPEVFITLVIIALLVQYGVTQIPAIQASVLFMSELIVAAIAAYFLAHETMSLIEMAGGCCILAAGMLSVSVGESG